MPNDKLFAENVWRELSYAAHRDKKEYLSSALGDNKDYIIKFIATARAESPEMKLISEAHTAMDMLFAQLILAKKGFYPSKSGYPWEVMVKLAAARKLIGQEGPHDE
jgi:hypothetical protein